MIPSQPSSPEARAIALLRRLREWDQFPETADGPYWMVEIDGVLGNYDATRPSEARDHRCSGCDHRWRGGPAAPNEWTGAELCGDCWRRVQLILHRPEASDQQRAREIARSHCAIAYQKDCERDLIAAFAAVRAEQAASDTAQREALARERDSAERRCGRAVQQKEAAEASVALEQARIATLEGLCRDQERALATLEAERVALERALREILVCGCDSCSRCINIAGDAIDGS